MKKAIVIYIDDNPKLIEEFTWLWKTWNMLDLADEFDIVAYCNPSAIPKLPSHPNFIKKPLDSLSDTTDFWKEYKFVNSFAMFNDEEEVKWIKSKYSHILKTDADVFLTEHIKGLTPSKIMIGYGGYMNYEDKFDEINSNLSRIAKKLKLKNNGYSHVGASIFGETSTVVTVIKEHFVLTNYILLSEWKEGNGEWPGWTRGVSSMYAIHLVVNHRISNQHISLYSLDSLCWNNLIDSNTYHIHAWHGGDFSKHKWFKGEYLKLESTTVPTVAKDYCLWVVSNPLEELTKVVNKSNQK